LFVCLLRMAAVDLLVCDLLDLHGLAARVHGDQPVALRSAVVTRCTRCNTVYTLQHVLPRRNHQPVAVRTRLRPSAVRDSTRQYSRPRKPGTATTDLTCMPLAAHSSCVGIGPSVHRMSTCARGA